MASTFLMLSLVAIVIYIFWILLNPQKRVPPKKTANKKISKKGHQKLKGKSNKQQVSLSSAEKIRKEKTEQMKIDPELVGRVIRHWLRER
jgi:flagellar biosynthesis/type III secretory pathway M-ring protein FliF/YscJ